MHDNLTSAVGSTPSQDRPVILVVSPFYGLNCPALGASQLKGNLERAGIKTEVVYANLDFAEHITPLQYEWLSATGLFLAGEYIFSHTLYDKTEADLDAYLSELIEGSDYAQGLASLFPGESLREFFQRLIDSAVKFVRDEAVPGILAKNPWMVGFSSVFESHCASLGMAKQLKEKCPDLITVIGGPNCEGESGIETLRQFPFMDYVARGECDRTFVDFVRDLRDGKPAGHMGFLSRGDAEPRPASPPLHGPELDENAYPDFVDYFERLSTFAHRDQIDAGLALETSRGCWWGAKSHCTFCAFNRDGMVYRSKSPDRAVAEIRGQIERYGVPRTELTDNILDMDYFKNVVKRLEEDPPGELFWETKANLSMEQIRMMKRAGIVWIQPGIESLSDNTLKLMRKGSTQLQNVQLLKLATESGLRIVWNWLYGFPGEDVNEIEELRGAVQAIHHILPPGAAPVIYLERFSPYFMTPEEWGIDPIRSAPAYRHIYPLPEEALFNLAFFFECDHFKMRAESADYAELQGMVKKWNYAYQHSHFLAAPREEELVLIDSRLCAKQFRRDLRGLERRIYEFCWGLRGEKEIVKAFSDEAPADEILTILKSFADDKLVLHRKKRYLSLATDIRLGYRDWPKVFPGGQLKHEAAALPAEPPESKIQQRMQKLKELATGRLTPAQILRQRKERRAHQEFVQRGIEALETAKRLADPSLPPIGEERPAEKTAIRS